MSFLGVIGPITSTGMGDGVRLLPSLDLELGPASCGMALELGFRTMSTGWVVEWAEVGTTEGPDS